MALHLGRDPTPILENRRALSKELNLDKNAWICADQTHSRNYALVSGKDRGRGARDSRDALPQRDALILGEPGLQGLIFTADCLGLIVYDKNLHRGALIHAGWRGTAGGIIQAVLMGMVHHLSSSLKDLLICASPAISSCCYQVNKTVYQGLTQNCPSSEEAFYPDGEVHGEPRWRLNLEEAAFIELRGMGLSSEQMEGSGLCTCCHKELPSYRREGTHAGRLGTFLALL